MVPIVLRRRWEEVGSMDIEMPVLPHASPSPPRVVNAPSNRRREDDAVVSSVERRCSFWKTLDAF